MQRLTMRNKNGKTIDLSAMPGRACGLICNDYTCNNCPVNDALNKLADYEDAEESGMLIHPPCKAGSKVYEIVDDCNFGADCYTRRMCNGCEHRDLHIEPLILVSEYDVVFRMKDFGKTVFLTSKAAEQALEKMKGA